MAQQIVRGHPITLTGHVRDNTGVLTDPDDLTVSIVNALGVTIIDLAAPARISTGVYQYVYTPPADAPLGAWAIQWYATIGGDSVFDEDGFTVERDVGSATPSMGSDVCSAWATSEDMCSPCTTYAFTEEELDLACLVASDILYNLTGKQWPGVCADSIRPIARWRRADVGDQTPRWWPSVDPRYPFGFCSCNRSRRLGCNRIPEIELPGRPVDKTTITVKIDGNAFTDFRLDDHNKLVRLDGQGWPCCQDLLRDDTEEHTWSVSYSYGTAAPAGGVKAAAALGCQLAIAYNPDAVGEGKCKLPKRVQTMTRAGTTIALIDPLTLFKDGMTGLSEVDLWVASVMAGRARRRGRLLIPGRRSHVRRTNQ